jgi:Flp pilus assembly protein TadB
MILAAACTAAACFTGLYLLAEAVGLSRHPQMDVVRASTLSPIEWRERQQAVDSWYGRWLRPIATITASRLHLRPTRLDPAYLVQCGIDPEQLDGVEFRALKIAGALAGLVVGLLFAIFLGGVTLFIPLLAWGGYVAPSRYLSHSRRTRQQSIHRELPEVVSMIRAFVVAGMPMERALHLISADPGAPGVLKAEIRAALGRYGLGLTIEEALQQIGERTGTDDIALFVSALAQSKRMGTGLEQTLRDQELLVRMNQRNRSTAEAARVGTKLLGVLAGIYLPEFVILIMIPLFSGIIQRAFG